MSDTPEEGSTWSSVKSWASEKLEGPSTKHTEASLPWYVKLFLILGFLGAFLWVVIYFIKLGEGKISGSQSSDDEKKGICAERCAVSWKKVLMMGFLAPMLLWAGFMGLAYGLFAARVENKAKEMIWAKGKAGYHNAKTSKKIFSFGAIAFFIWILISFGFYAIMSLGNIKMFKQKEYHDKTTKTDCKAAKKSWCSKVGPDTFWFFLLSLVSFFVIMVVGVVKYVKARSPEDEFCREADMVGEAQMQDYKVERRQNKRSNLTSVDQLLTTNYSGKSAEDFQTRVAVADELRNQGGASRRCPAVYKRLMANINKFNQQIVKDRWDLRKGKDIGLIRKVQMTQSKNRGEIASGEVYVQPPGGSGQGSGGGGGASASPGPGQRPSGDASAYDPTSLFQEGGEFPIKGDQSGDYNTFDLDGGGNGDSENANGRESNRDQENGGFMEARDLAKNGSSGGRNKQKSD